MRYSIFYKKTAADELLQLPSNVALRVRKSINNLAENPRPPGCKKIKGTKDAYRIRIGSYRVIYTISDAVLIIMIFRIAHRKRVYKQ